MNKSRLSRLIHRLSKGVASKEEKQQLEEFWEEAVQDTSVLDAMSGSDRNTLKGEIFKAVQAQIKRTDTLSRKRRTWVLSVAAAIALLGLMVALLGNFLGQHVIETTYGEHRHVTLPDGSQIILNGNSKLSYPNQNDGSPRDVWIEGEMFFNVTHTLDGQKFVVHISDRVSIEVLGTEFDVKNRAENVQVMLVRGTVELHVQSDQKEATYTLAPGELATLVDKKVDSRPVEEQRQYTSWTTNTLVFDHTSLHDVSLMLKEVYGVNVTFSDDSLQQRELTGEISSASVDEILYALAQTFDLEVGRKGNSVHISEPDADI